MTRRGLTLVELLAVLVVFGLITGIAGVALAAGASGGAHDVVDELIAARSAAVRQGTPVEWRRGGTAVRFYPDGSASGGRVVAVSLVIAIDPLTGALHVAQ